MSQRSEKQQSARAFRLEPVTDREGMVVKYVVAFTEARDDGEPATSRATAPTPARQRLASNMIQIDGRNFALVPQDDEEEWRQSLASYAHW